MFEGGKQVPRYAWRVQTEVRHNIFVCDGKLHKNAKVNR